MVDSLLLKLRTYVYVVCVMEVQVLNSSSLLSSNISTEPSTNLTSFFGRESYVVVQVVPFFLFVVPIFVLFSITAVGVLLDRNLKIPLKAPITATLLAGIVSGVSMSVFGLSHAAFALDLIDLSTQHGSTITATYLITVSGLQRSLSVLILSVVIYTIVRYGEKSLKMPAVVAVTVFLWSLPILLLLPLLFNVLWMEPIYVDVYYITSKLDSTWIFLLSLIIVLVEVPAKVISLSMVLAVFVRTRRNIVSNKKDAMKTLGRFLLGMFILNIFSTFLGLFSAVIPAVPNTNANSDGLLELSVFIYIILFAIISPEPFLLMCLFKTIPGNLKAIFRRIVLWFNCSTNITSATGEITSR